LIARETISRSRDVIGAHQNLNGYVTESRPFQGWFAIRALPLAIVILPTKFKVSISTYYEDMKGNTKCRKLDGLG